MSLIKDGEILRTYEEQVLHLTETHREQLTINDNVAENLKDLGISSNLGGYNLVRFSFSKHGEFYRFNNEEIVTQLTGHIGDYIEFTTGGSDDIPAYGYYITTDTIILTSLGDFIHSYTSMLLINVTANERIVQSVELLPFSGTSLLGYNPDNYKKQVFNVINDLLYNDRTQYVSFDINLDGVYNYVFIGASKIGKNGRGIFSTNGTDFNSVKNNMTVNDLVLISALNDPIPYIPSAVVGDIYIFVDENTFLLSGNIKGSVGNTGERGEQGIQGPTGNTGSTGPKGETGSMGLIGQQGIQGIQGIQGLTGANGAIGATGATGDIGLPGPEGPIGIPGNVGPQGIPGTTGATGSTGAQGTKGDKGDRGDTGSSGAIGSTGAIGPQGPQGQTGPTGATGPTGSQGVIGPRGTDGSSFKISNTVNTSAQLPPATAALSGIAYAVGVSIPFNIYVCLSNNGGVNYIWQNQGTIQGPQGPTGSQGITGATGAPGATGAIGPIGPIGNTGLKGDTGSVGSQGVKGDTGATGPKGDTGATGSNGTNGVKGDKGDRGDTGITGNQGIQGPTGPTGPKGADGSNGLQGPVGNIGPIGLTGPQGTQGVAGNSGIQGIQGPIGVTGATGPKGDTGATGAKGNTGATGATGLQGPKGLKGDTGAVGPIGNTGPIGPIGPIGPEGTSDVIGITAHSGGPEGNIYLLGIAHKRALLPSHIGSVDVGGEIFDVFLNTTYLLYTYQSCFIVLSPRNGGQYQMFFTANVGMDNHDAGIIVIQMNNSYTPMTEDVFVLCI